ncbi:MAG: 2-C-methyl-D-erythritol 2,4-cyclodiphosphate synthase [Oscillibacter sp.]|nr:2-C-methyl-D-erythritol 2,4-cyclodiphosphate synthase [Oscillibacter sp.]
MTTLRIGHGYDVHRVTDGRPLVLGGVGIPWDKGLLGHSDADVLTHAVMDALCGAARLGDIGRLFPDTDPQYKGISSLILLRDVRERLTERGYVVVNVDATVIAQAPKLSPYRERMEAALADVLGIPPDCVNVKATTEEKLGFTGDGSGIAAHAVALLERVEKPIE